MPEIWTLTFRWNVSGVLLFFSPLRHFCVWIMALLGQAIINLHFSALGFVVTVPSDFTPLILTSNTAGCKLNSKEIETPKKKKNPGRWACKGIGNERWEFQRGVRFFELENGWDKYSQRLRHSRCTEAIFPRDSWIITCPLEMWKSLHERECNEGRYKGSHQKEYLKWDLQESKDLPGKIECSNRSVPQVVVFSLKLVLLFWWIAFLNRFYELTRWASTVEMWLQGHNHTPQSVKKLQCPSYSRKDKESFTVELKRTHFTTVMKMGSSVRFVSKIRTDNDWCLHVIYSIGNYSLLTCYWCCCCNLVE